MQELSAPDSALILSEIPSEHDRQAIRAAALQWIDREYRGVFPAPMPVSLARAHLPVIRQKKYFVSPKANGERVLLYAFRNAEGSAISALLHRNGSVQQTNLRLPEKLYAGTIADVEILRYEGHVMLVVFDCAVVAGRRLVDCTYSERHAEGEQLYAYGANGSGRNEHVAFYVKKIHPLDKLGELLDALDTTVSEDGIIFTPDEHPWRCGRDDLLFKWKSLHTVDLVAEYVGDTDSGIAVRLYAALRGELQVYGNGVVTWPVGETGDDADWIEAFPRGDALERVKTRAARPVIECASAFGRANAYTDLQPLLWRRDKDAPNDVSTIESTMQCAREAIDADVLRQVLCS